MKVKFKKVMSVAVVSAILAAQTLMPVAAAGGSIESELTTKTPILRVQVPTTMAIAVDQFDTAGTGSQIFSDEFGMQNKSEIPVKVSVESKLEYTAADVELVSAKKAASALGEKEAWIATAALTAAGKDHDSKTIAELEGNEPNITTFAKGEAAGEATTKQEFYLAGATAKYTMLQKAGASITVDAAALGGYAELYELTAAGTLADDAALQALVDAGDVYHVASAANGAELTKIAKGTQGVTKGSDTYYTVGTTMVLAKDLTAADDSKLYVYADSDASAGGKDIAGFRYIGVLSDGKAGGWSDADLDKITISYDITGLTTPAFTEASKDGAVVYGYRAENSAITLNGNVMTIMLNGGTFKSGTLKLGDTTAPLASSAGTWGSITDGVTFTFNSTWAAAIKGKTVEVSVTLEDGTVLTESFNVPN